MVFGPGIQIPDYRFVMYGLRSNLVPLSLPVKVTDNRKSLQGTNDLAYYENS